MLTSGIDSQYNIIHSGVALSSKLADDLLITFLDSEENAFMLAPIVLEGGEQSLQVRKRKTENGTKKIVVEEVMRCLFSGLLSEGDAKDEQQKRSENIQLL